MNAKCLLLLILLLVAVRAEAVGPTQFGKAFRRVEPSVVAVEAKVGTERTRHGSGFVVASGGWVACASMTVEGATEVRVRNGDRWYPARLVGNDPEVRAALLKVGEQEEPPPWPVVSVSRQGRLKEGGWVVAVERDDAGAVHPVTGMVVEARRAQPGTREPVAMVDAPAAAGSPLVNPQGEVVGMSLGRISARQGRAVSVAPMRDFLARAMRSP